MRARYVHRLLSVAAVASATAAVPTSAVAQTLPNVANLANWSDLKCYQPDTAQNLSNVPPITLTQLNPIFKAPNKVIPDHTVQLTDLRQLCVPVQKNQGQPSADTVPFLRYFDLACYDITLTQGNPVLPPLILQHRNPVLIGTAAGVPALLPVALQREAVGFASPPAQLCVPVAKNQSAFPIPPEVRALVQYLDFECFNFSSTTQTPPLNTNLTLTHLNPVLLSQGQQPENVRVTNPRSLCVPVNKNHTPLPAAIEKILSKIDLKRYDIAGPTGGTLPPIQSTLQLTQLDPVLANVPPVTLSSLTPRQVMLPVAKCNPFQATVQTIIPPDNSFAGPLYFNLQSNCPGSPRACGASVVLPVGTTPTSKCNLLVAAVNATCGPSGFSASTPDACASGTFTVIDTGCTSSSPPPGAGLVIGLSNDEKLFTQETATGTLPDYEQDLITPGCGGQDSDHLNIIKGNPTGVPFIPGSTAGVTFVVDTAPLGGSMVSITVSPTTGLTAAQIIASGVGSLNQQLQFGGTGVNCSQDTAHPRAFHCSQPSGEPIPAGIQNNDTGLVRGSLAGSASTLQKLANCIDTGACPSFSHANVVAAAQVPAADSRMTALLVAALGAAGTWIVRRRIARSTAV